MAKILDGKGLSEKLMTKLKRKISKKKSKPKLVIIQIGSLGESNTYIKKKKEFAEEIYVPVVHKKYKSDVSEKRVTEDIESYNADSSVHGIMVQLPIPSHLNTSRIMKAIDPSKDVDGLTAVSTQRLVDDKHALLPAVTRGILTLLENHKIQVAKKRVVVVGDSAWVGRPTALAFLNKKALVTTCNEHTKNLSAETRMADILVVAVGKPGLITDKHVSRGQVVVDVGTTLRKGKVFGDVDYKAVEGVVGAITPVPGGVGPMTVYSLFENLLDAHNALTKRKK